MRRPWKLLLVAAVLLAALIRYYPPARLLAIYAVGRSPVCPLSNALKSDENLQRQITYNEQIIKSSKLLETDPAGYELWDTPHAKYWIPAGSRYVLPFNLAEQERRIYGVGEQTAKAGDVVLDCGANVGVTIRRWLEDGASKIVAIEPAPENILVLKRNFAAEIAAGKVIVYEKGVWDKEETLTLQVDPQNSAADSFIIHREGGKEVMKIPVTTIDKLVAELNLERVDFIKMDIEGAEQRALAGARETLAKYHPRMALASYHVPDDPEKFPQIIRAIWPGYTMECGPCAEANGRVRPDVLYFR
jgi:FkbM family methyltransferase